MPQPKPAQNPTHSQTAVRYQLTVAGIRDLPSTDKWPEGSGETLGVRDLVKYLRLARKPIGVKEERRDAVP